MTLDFDLARIFHELNVRVQCSLESNRPEIPSSQTNSAWYVRHSASKQSQSSNRRHIHVRVTGLPLLCGDETVISGGM